MIIGINVDEPKKKPFYLANVADHKITLCELKRDIMEWKKGKNRKYGELHPPNLPCVASLSFI